MTNTKSVQADLSKRLFLSAVLGVALTFTMCVSHSQESAIPESEPRADNQQVDSLITARDRANRIVVKVMVNDAGPFDFLLDTGANQSVVGARFAKQMNLESAGTGTSNLRGITGETKVPRVKVAKLEAGSLLIKNSSMAVIEDAVLLGLDGVLGVDGFRNKRLSAHIVDRQVTIARSSGRRPGPEYASFQVDFRHGLLVLVPASVSGTPLKAVIDTGSSVSLGNAHLRRVIGSRSKFNATPTATRVQGVSGVIQRGETEWTSLIRLESQRKDGYEAALLRDVPISYGEFYVFELWELTGEPALIVGMDILNLLDEVIIDYGRKELLLKNRSPSTGL